MSREGTQRMPAQYTYTDSQLPNLRFEFPTFPRLSMLWLVVSAAIRLFSKS